MTVRARSTDPATSHAAAASISPAGENASQALVLRLLRALGPLPDALVVAHAGPGFSPSRLRTARHELVRAGKVRDTGQTVRLPRGKTLFPHRVFEAVPQEPQLRLLP